MSAWKEYQMGLMDDEEYYNHCAEENARERYLAEWDDYEAEADEEDGEDCEDE